MGFNYDAMQLRKISALSARNARMTTRFESGPRATRLAGPTPRIASVGTAVPPNSYTQSEILDVFGITDRRIRSVFLNGGIERRHLAVPEKTDSVGHRPESQTELINKHLRIGRELGRAAIDSALERLGASRADIRYLCCVSTTGFVAPGFSAYLIKDLGLDEGCSRLDVVGMGCNAGLNALAAVGTWSSSHPGELALLVCIEVCSALYIADETIECAVVNSLFGDGAAAATVVASEDACVGGAKLMRFSSWIIPEAISAMRVDWREDHGRFGFFLDADVPYVIGANAERACDRLLENTGILRSQIAHWIVHSGGKKVIDAVRVNLGLSRADVRHTLSVLRDHGNISSCSFLFSYERFLSESTMNADDYGVLMTMGPGSTIEMALVQW